MSTTSVNRPRPPSLPQPSRLQRGSPPGRGQHATTCYVFRFRRKFGELSFAGKVTIKHGFTTNSLLTLVERDFRLNCIVKQEYAVIIDVADSPKK